VAGEIFSGEKLNGNEMNYFLKDVADYLYRRKNGDFRNMIVVFPGRRASLFFNHFLSQMSEKPLWAPRYLTISELVQQLSGFQISDQLTLIFRLYSVFKKITGSAETFDTFYNYSGILLSDFDDIDKNVVRAEALFTNLADLKALEDYKEYLDNHQLEIIRDFWNVLIKSRDSKEKEQFISIWESLAAIYNELGKSLEKEGIVYEGKAYLKALNEPNPETEKFIEKHELAFIGFNALSRSEELLFDRFKNKGNAFFFWDYDESYLKDTIHEAGFFLRKYVYRYPSPPDFKKSSHVVAEDQKVTILSVPLAVSQAKVIKECISILGSDTIESPLDTALILADESILSPVVNSIPENLGEVNVSMGYPIIDTPAHSFFDSLIDLHKNKKRKGETQEYLYYHQDFFGILDHSFLNLQDSKEFQVFRNDCIKRNLVYIDPSLLPLRGTVADLIFRPLDETRSFGSYARDIIEQITEDAGKQGDKYFHTQWQLEILFTIRKMMTRFETLMSLTDIELSFPVILNLLKRILKSLSVPFSGEPLKGLQVMGILETRTLDFEKLVIMPMNEGSFPKTGHVPSMIPYALREGFGLPTLRHQDAIFGYYFYRLLHRSKQVVLVYNSQTKGLQRGEPSRFVRQLQYERKIPPVLVESGYKVGLLTGKTISAKKGSEVFAKLERYQDPQGTAFLSPSALNTYINCSLKFYFRYIEQIREPDSITEEIEGDVFGSILHKTMSEIYGPYTGQVCTPDIIDTILKNREVIDKAIDHAFASEYFNEPVTRDSFKGRNLIVRSIIEKYTEGILEYDRKSGGFTMIASERSYIAAIKPGNQESPLRIGGFIDRIDLKDGVKRIIDYKTGSGKNIFRDIKSLFSSGTKNRNSSVFQVFLYSWVFHKHERDAVRPLLYHIRNIYDEKYSPDIVQSENRNRKIISNFAEFAQEFEEHLQLLVNEIYNAEIPFTQTEDAEQCRFCPFNEICLRETKSY